MKIAYSEFYVENSCKHTGYAPCGKCRKQCKPRIKTVINHHKAYSYSERERTVYRQIGEIKNGIGDIHTHSHYSIYQSLLKYSDYQSFNHDSDGAFLTSALSVIDCGIVTPIFFCDVSVDSNFTFCKSFVRDILNVLTL